MFTILIIFLSLITVGVTLLLDDIPGNDEIAHFFVGVGIFGALIVSGIMLVKWGW